MSGICKVIVKVMVNFKYIVFYVILMDEVDVIEFVVYCKKFKVVVVDKGIKLIYFLYVVKVLIFVLCEYLMLNIFLDDVF